MHDKEDFYLTNTNKNLPTLSSISLQYQVVAVAEELVAYSGRKQLN